MEYEAEKNRTMQLASLLMTMAIVGGTIAWAMSAG